MVFLSVVWWFRAVHSPHIVMGTPAGTHGCDLVSRVGLDQSANPVVVWLGHVSCVVRSPWRLVRIGTVHRLLDSALRS